MKTFLITVLSVFLATNVFAIDTEGYDTVTLSKAKEAPTPFCPVTKISDNSRCMSCHEMQPNGEGGQKFGLKELRLEAGYWMMPSCLDPIAGKNGELELRMDVNGTNSSEFRDAADYMYRHPEFKKLTVRLYTGGGSVMDAWEAVGIIEEMRTRGIKISTRCYGLAASAGVILLVAGDEGDRWVSKHAEIMMHKVWSFSMFKLDTPDSAEDTAETLKHFQKNINSYIISRSKLTKEKIEECIFKRDFWMTGEQAVQFGLADGFI